MAQINPCLKWSFISCNVICMTAGLIMYACGYLGLFRSNTANMSLYALAVALVSSVGVFGACKEKKWALILYFFGAFLEFIFCLWTSCLMLTASSKRVQIPLNEEETGFLKNTTFHTDVWVYKETCSLQSSKMNLVFCINLGIIFGLAFSLLILMIMSMVLLCQMRRKSVAIPVTSNEDPNPPTYSQLSMAGD
ncbi:hypothetical protein MATL_G00248460 [Megalops atlanticus]|uniref:Uncharacterized protein n=1 Tax=Megalops atlanticus TaxID=7932 RepID=A0A9D3T108_MEGAT|nr:hypothetical protein MATL_G00248460 [Megalops atlanticus]